MEYEKRTPLRLQILLFFVFTLAGAILVTFFLLPLVMHLLLPNLVKLFPDGKTGLAAWLLLAGFAALFVWTVSLFLRKKHRFLSAVLALLAVLSVIKTLPYLRYDDPNPVLQLELAATFHMEANRLDTEIYWSSFFVGSSMRSVSHAGAELGLSAKDQAELQDLLSDRRYTWIVASGQTVASVTWSCRDFVQYLLLPWQTGAVYPAEIETVPGEEDAVYVYRIPFAPIDNIF